MATLPTNLTKVNFDAPTDDPSAARAEFADNVDKVNQLLAGLGSGVFWDASAGDGLTVSASIASIDLATDPALEFTAGKIRVKVTAAISGILRSANGLEVDILGTTTDASPDINNDWLLTEDVSTGLLKKVHPSDIASTGGMRVFTVDGTFIQPSGITTVRVICIGGGGEGGGGASSFGGGGGGGGAYTEAIVTIAGNETVTIGQGGTGGGLSQPGNAGTATTFGALVTANGGLGGGHGTTTQVGGLGGVAITTQQELSLFDGVPGGTGVGVVGGDGGYHGQTEHGQPGQGAAVPGFVGANAGEGGSGAGGNSNSRADGFRGVCIVLF